MRIATCMFMWTACLIHNGGTVRILALLGSPTPSHHIVIRILLEELAHRGHNIVSMTTNPISYRKDSFEGTIKVIDVRNVSYSLWQDKLNKTNLYSWYSGNYKTYYAHLSNLPALVDAQLEEAEIQRILKDKSEVFDLVIAQNTVPIYYAASARFNVPLVTFACGVGNHFDYQRIGVPIHPLLYTHFMNKNILNIDFLSKLEVLLFQSWMDLIGRVWLLDYNKLVRKHFGSDAPTIEEMGRKVSLALSNIHPETHGIRPIVPTLIQAGGIHFKPREVLSLDLKQYLDQSSNGVIYMSFGTLINSSSLPSDKLMVFTKVFSRLPYNIIWKWDGDLFPEKSPNIFFVKWVSQQDLLGHPNIKAFITHSGMNSIDESIDNQVPIIGIPLVLDQHRNAKVAEKFGIGLALEYSTLTEDILYNAIMKVTKNASYIQDKPRPALEQAIWWVEYVLRHNGTEHLRAPTMDLYEYLILDVIAFVLVAIVVPVFLVFKFIILTLY